MDSDQNGAVMAHHRHALLDHSALKTFVSHLVGSACKQAGDMAFDDWTTIATDTGSRDLMRRSFPMEVRLIEHVEHLLGTRVRSTRFHRLRNADGQNLALMQGST
jgi:hypothetical protein